MAVVAADGRILEADAAARTAMSRFDPRGRVDGRVPDRLAALVASPSGVSLALPAGAAHVQSDGLRTVAHVLPEPPDRFLLVFRERRTDPSGETIASLGLSPREAEVLLLVARGLTNPQIGEALFISARTVRKHLENVFAKLGVHTRAGATAAAFRAADPTGTALG
ncbi:MAG: helix-turn-helix transcriptional regulator [Actinobacteria bacterium]|nr:helix-turn-helix transcriptional regulator [Actinomycetota bacterium]